MSSSQVGRAVVADDDSDSRGLLCRALRALGFEVFEAEDGEDLADQVAGLYAHGVDPTLVVSDIGMPICDGIEATRRLRSLSLTLPILLVTGFTDAEVRRAALTAGASEVLPKPIILSELQDAIARLRDK